MFAYCNNNPILWVDSSGREPVAIAAIAGTACQIAIVAIMAVTVFHLISLALQDAPTVRSSIFDEKTKAVGDSGSKTLPATSTPATPPNNNNDNKHDKRDYVKARTNKVANDWAKRAGWDSAEAFKRDFVGNQGSRFDIFLDRITRELLLIEKSTGRIITTGWHLP